MNTSQDVIVVREDKPYHHQMRPYGTLGPPYIITKHSLLYPKKRFKVTWKLLERERLTEELNRCFPSIYVLSHSICLILNSIIHIALQIALMSTNGAIWYVASGIWGGLYFLVTGAFGIYLVYYRSYWNLIISYALHLFGILIAIGAYLIVNIIAISLYSSSCEVDCYNHSVKPINYVCFFLGVICTIMLLVYLVLVPCYIMDSYNQHLNYQEKVVKTVETEPNLKDDALMHSWLYAQNNLNEDGSPKINSINYVITDYSKYPVIQAVI